jgi:hypothetical protein
MITATHRSTQIGIFDTKDQAHAAVDELHRAGFDNGQITMVMHHPGQEREQLTDLDGAKAAQVTGEAKDGEGAAIGAVAGAVVGGAVAAAILSVPGLGPVLLAGGLIGTGALAGLATGVVGGALGGGLVGALVGLDIPEDEARLYEQELKNGKALVGVHAGERSAEAADILCRCGGHELTAAAVHPDAGPQLTGL